MNRIRVIHIVPTLSPGGAERVAVHIVNGLNRERFEPIIISLANPMNCDLDHMLARAGVEVRYLEKKPGFDYRVYRRLHRVLTEYQPDVVHTHLQVLRYALPTMLLLGNAVLLHTVHNLAEREIEPPARVVHRYAFSHGVVPIAVAEEVAQSMKRLYKIAQCGVIANCIPTASYSSPQVPREQWRTQEGFANDDVLFVCVARFARQKNHALLLKAFATGPASDPRARLILAGDGTLRGELEMQVAALGLGDRVRFLGVRTDIQDILGASDVFVLSSDYEGNPLSILEAMAAGLPTVATGVGAVPSLLADKTGGVLVQPGDAEGFSKAMESLLANHKVRESMGAAAARRARENFDVTNMVRAYEEVYERLHSNMRADNPSMAVRQSVTSG
jgi:glycosyltransferase involved in cell wall biosynthesis